MKQHVQLSIAFAVGALGAAVVTAIVLHGREKPENSAPAQRATHVAPPSAAIAPEVSALPSAPAPATPRVSEPLSRQPQIAEAAAVIPQPAATATEDRVAKAIAHAEAVIREKGYDPETAMRYRVHVARTLARQGIGDPRLEQWIKQAAPPSAEDQKDYGRQEVPKRSPEETAAMGIAIIERELAAVALPHDYANALRHECALQLIAGGADATRLEEWFKAKLDTPPQRADETVTDAQIVSSDAIAALGRKISQELKKLLTQED